MGYITSQQGCGVKCVQRPSRAGEGRFVSRRRDFHIKGGKQEAR
jgi:hypothetical protein